MKRIVWGLMVLMGVVLAGCSQTQKKTTSSTRSTTSVSKKVSESSKNSSTEGRTNNSSQSKQTLWNANKSAQLAAFMSDWGPKMNQEYKSYTPESNVNYYGAQYPDELSKNNTAVDDSPVSIEWSGNGEGNKDYAVVAVYSDAEQGRTPGVMDSHLYLFTIHNGQAVALVTMQNQGAEDGKIHFSPTKNTDVSSNFTKIFNNQAASETNQPSDSTSDANSNSSSSNQSNVYYQGSSEITLPTTDGTVQPAGGMGDATQYWPATMTIDGTKQAVVAAYTRMGEFVVYTKQPTDKDYSFNYSGDDYQDKIGQTDLDSFDK